MLLPWLRVLLALLLILGCSGLGQGRALLGKHSRQPSTTAPEDATAEGFLTAYNEFKKQNNNNNKIQI